MRAESRRLVEALLRNRADLAPAQGLAVENALREAAELLRRAAADGASRKPG